MRREGPPRTFEDFVAFAIGASTDSPCRSKRGAVAFRGVELVAVGFNQKPDDSCDGSERCKATCRREAVHAEEALVVSTADLDGADVIHVKTIGGALVVSGGPTCVECSKLLAAAGVAAVWLYHLEGWRRYPIAEFHRLSLDAARPCLDAIATAGELEGADLVAALRSIGAGRANVLEAIVARAGDVLSVLIEELRGVDGCTHELCSLNDTIAESKIADVLRRILAAGGRS